MTVLLLILLALLATYLFIKVLFPGQAPPVTDEEWVEWQDYLKAFHKSQGRSRTPNRAH